MHWPYSSFRVTPFFQLDEGELGDVMVVLKWVLLKTVYG
jgi:hypothetical protein